MIDENDLLGYSRYFVDQRQLEKDYLLNLLLKLISFSKMSENLVFKGGTALNYFYGLDRFSEDLDFSYIPMNSDKPDQIIRLIKDATEIIIKDFSNNYKIRKSKYGVVERDTDGNAIGVRGELFVEGPLFSITGTSHKIKMDISIRNDLLLIPKKADKFVSKYKDIGSLLVYVMDMREIMVEKACAILERDNARDIYDAYFISDYKKIKLDHVLFHQKAKARNAKYDTKELIRKVKGFSATLWKEELSYLVKQLPDLKEVKASLYSAFE